MKVAIVGIGKLGKIHTRIYGELEEFELAGICDIDRPDDKNLGQIPFFYDYRDLLDQGVEAVSIATPTTSHHEIAKFFLDNGVHCLIEKPITISIEQADELMKIARKKKVFIMVGMVERFNKAYNEARKMIKNPKFIESHRLGPYPHRSLDISVVLDLMIHDLDIILDLVDAPVSRVESVGIHALSKTPDIANARITFENGCIANVTASRISDERMRRTRVFFDQNYISLDFADHTIKAYSISSSGIDKKVLDIPVEEPLKREILYFHENIVADTLDYTIAQNAVAALDLALKIETALN